MKPKPVRSITPSRLLTQTDTRKFNEEIRDLLFSAIGERWGSRAFDEQAMNQLLIATLTFVANVVALSEAPLVMGREAARFLEDAVSHAVEYQQGAAQ